MGTEQVQRGNGGGEQWDNERGRFLSVSMQLSQQQQAQTEWPPIKRDKTMACTE